MHRDDDKRQAALLSFQQPLSELLGRWAQPRQLTVGEAAAIRGAITELPSEWSELWWRAYFRQLERTHAVRERASEHSLTQLLLAVGASGSGSEAAGD